MIDALSPEMRELIARILLIILTVLLLWGARRIFFHLLLLPMENLLERRNFPAVDAIHAVVATMSRYLIFALGVTIIAQIAGVSAMRNIYVERLTGTFIILAIFVSAYQAIEVLAVSSTHLFRLTGLHIEDKLLPYIRTGLKLIVISLTIVLIVQEWGFNVAGLVAGLGLGGLAFSLAAQDTIGNLFGFSTIVGDRPFTVGDFIQTSDVSGIVEHVGLRSTRVRQDGFGVITVPNGTLANSPILRLHRRRVDLLIGVTYNTTDAQIETVVEKLREMLRNRDHVEKHSIDVYFVGFGASSLDIMVRCFITLRDWQAFMRERETINLEVMRIVRGNGLSFAFPSRSLYIE
ncbi:MAG: hypothetical protein CUN54_09050, partial [Phototrophicales bacterium]